MHRPVTVWDKPLPALVLLSLVATLIYSHTFSVPFLFDDTSNIVENPQIKDLSHFRDLSNSRYVGFLSFALNYQFGGLNVWGYHLVNLLIHITNGFWVYLLVSLLLRQSHPDFPPWVPLASALLFISHPIQTQAVTYLVQRFASLATLFYLSAVVCYLKWRIAPPSSRTRYVWYAGALLSVVLAMKTKEIGFTLPFMILLVETVFFRPVSQSRWVSLIPFVLTLPIIPLSLPGALGEAEGFARETSEISRASYLLTQFRVIVTYLRLLILPLNQNLDYDYPLYHSFFDPPVVLSFLLLLALGGMAVYGGFSSGPFRLMGFGVLWFFLTLSVESSIIPIRDVIFEHRVYLPGVGIFLAGSLLIHHLVSRPRIRVGILTMAVAALSIATYERNTVWRDEAALWADVIQKSPNKYRGHNNLGATYMDQDRLDEAEAHLKTALALKPDYAEAHINRGSVLRKKGLLEEAYQEIQAGLSLDPQSVSAYNALGLVYYDQGKVAEAITWFQKGLGVHPYHVSTHNNLGLAYAGLGRLEEAVSEYQTAIRLNPGALKPRLNLAMAYATQGRFQEAVQENHRAARLEPNNAGVYNNLGMVYYKAGRYADAIVAYQTALRLDGDFAGAHNNLGAAFLAVDRPEEAVQEYQTALSLNPNHVQAHYNLGQAYRRLGRTEEAVRFFEKALQLDPRLEPARNALETLKSQ